MLRDRNFAVVLPTWTAGLAVFAMLVAGCSVTPQATVTTLPSTPPSSSSTTSSSVPPTSSTPPTTSSTLRTRSQVGPFEVSTVSADEYFVLAGVPCGGGTCTELLETRDGGRTFQRRTVPPLLQQGVGEQLFAFYDAVHGFAYEPGPNMGEEPEPLYVTDDAGGSWQPVELGGEVMAYTAAGGEGYAVLATCTPTCTDLRLARSPLGRTSWTFSPLPAPIGRGTSNVSITSSGNDVWIAFYFESGAVLLRSNDQGASISVGPSPCTSGLGSSFEAASPTTLWAVCGLGTTAGLFRSADGGRTFTQLRAYPADRMLNDAAFGASSPTSGLLCPGGGADADQHWFHAARPSLR